MISAVICTSGWWPLLRASGQSQSCCSGVGQPWNHLAQHLLQHAPIHRLQLGHGGIPDVGCPHQGSETRAELVAAHCGGWVHAAHHLNAIKACAPGQHRSTTVVIHSAGLRSAGLQVVAGYCYPQSRCAWLAACQGIGQPAQSQDSLCPTQHCWIEMFGVKLLSIRLCLWPPQCAWKCIKADSNLLGRCPHQ